MATRKQVKKQARKQAKKRSAKPASRKPAAKATGGSSDSVAQEFLKELDYELPATRRVIERFPTDKGPWKPHPRSSAYGHLTQLLAKMVGVLADMLEGKDLDLAAGPGYSFESTDTLLRDFDGNASRLRANLKKAKAGEWSRDWHVRAGDQVYDTSKRKDAFRNTINHLVHHRGQATVYMRLNEVKVPSLYGPTADERMS